MNECHISADAFQERQKSEVLRLKVAQNLRLPAQSRVDADKDGSPDGSE